MNIFNINANDNKIGGASRIAVDIHEQLLNLGHKSFMALGKKNYLDSNFYEIPRNIIHKFKSYIFSSDIDFFQSDKILKLEEYKKCDIVHCHNLHGWYFNLNTLKKISSEKPIVWTLHDMWAINPISGHTSNTDLVNNLYTVSNRKLYPKTLWNNDSYLSNEKNKIYNSININIVSPSNWLINKIKKTSLGRQKLFHIENGIDTNIFKPRKDFLANEYIPLNNNKKTIIYISALAKSNIYKGFDDFLWIANNLPQNEYQIICVGAEDSYISKNIYFIKQTHDKSFIAKLISRADLLILTSSHENFPLVILEALACRTAVISYNTGGISEILDNLPNCKLVPISDRVYFLQCIKNFFSNELSYKSKPIELRLKVLERFSLKKMIDKYIGLYGDILKIN
jgi:glycosyltransferase involved in cell wall biosynthesis